MRALVAALVRAIFDASGSSAAKLRTRVMETVGCLRAARRHAASERMLRQLGPHLLRDIGMDPGEIRQASREECMARLHIKTMR